MGRRVWGNEMRDEDVNDLGEKKTERGHVKWVEEYDTSPPGVISYPLHANQGKIWTQQKGPKRSICSIYGDISGLEFHSDAGTHM